MGVGLASCMDIDRAIGALARAGNRVGAQSTLEDLKMIATVYKCLSTTLEMNKLLQQSECNEVKTLLIPVWQSRLLVADLILTLDP